MTTFSIDTDNNITAFAEYEDALNHRIGSTEGTFTNEKELATLSAGWLYSHFGWATLNLAVLPLLVVALLAAFALERRRSALPATA